MSKPRFRRNVRQRADGLELLRSLDDRAAAAVVLDPQYRSILDAQKYGNEGERQSGRAALPQMTDETISEFVAESIRVLQSSGHLFLWIDKFLLFEGAWQRWLPDIMPARLVDGIIWDKDRIGQGRRSRYTFEALVIIQKGPTRAQDIWKDRGIPDVFPTKAERARHPHAKPVLLLQRLIECVTSPGDLVVDPCAGSYTTLDACRASAREFMGGDLL